MWRAGGELRRQAIEIALIFGALLAHGRRASASGGAARRRRRGRWPRACCCSRCRSPPRFAPRRPDRRAAPRSICCSGSASASRITLAVAQDGLLINNGRDGTSALLECWSPRWELWTLAPSFIAPRCADRAGCTRRGGWRSPAAAGCVAVAMARARGPARRRSPPSATFGGALLVVAITFPLAAGRRRRCRTSICGARSRLAALDGFDARARPAAVVYDPLRKVRRVDVLPQLALGVQAGAAHRSAAGARDSQRPLLAAGRHLRHRRDVRRSACRRGRRRCRCRSAASARRSRPGRCSRSRARHWHTIAVAAGRRQLRRLPRPARDRARDRRDHHHAHRRRRRRRAAARADRCSRPRDYDGATRLLPRRADLSGAAGLLDHRRAAGRGDRRRAARAHRRRSCCASTAARRPTT